MRLFRVSTLLICVACFCFGRKDRCQVESSLRPGSLLRFTDVGLYLAGVLVKQYFPRRLVEGDLREFGVVP